MPYVLAAILGLVFGSFLNVCIARLPRGESIVRPRSHCPRCGHPIRWYDNVPVLSYALLGGRCRDCRVRISALYPLVEILTASFLVLDYAVNGLSLDFVKAAVFGMTWHASIGAIIYASLEFVKAAVFGMLLLVLIFTDLRDRRIPHVVTIPGIFFGLLLSLVLRVDARPVDWILGRWEMSPNPRFLSLLGSLTGALVGGGLFYAIGEAFYRVGGRKKEYLGFGDVMLMLMVGTFLGAPLTLMTMLFGSLGGSVLALIAIRAKPELREYQWPYGSFLGAAGLYVILGGRALFEAYLHWSGVR
ncbi:MAG: prepilin peptidase [Terriglobia bacterium]